MDKSKPVSKADLQGDPKSELIGDHRNSSCRLPRHARHQKHVNAAAEVKHLTSIQQEESDQACYKLYVFCFFSKCT